jgi:hypothetical protein
MRRAKAHQELRLTADNKIKLMEDCLPISTAESDLFITLFKFFMLLFYLKLELVI